MKPFDLQRALAGDPVITQDGKPVKIAGYNPDALYDGERVIGWVDNVVMTWNESGKIFTEETSSRDLFMAPKKRTVYVAIGSTVRAISYDESEANAWVADSRRGKVYPLEIEE